jgi:membrane protein YdbS with pleckstrin-like domain
MKAIISLLAIPVIIGASLAWVWPVVEFILYLFKDRQFNWWSVWACLICWALALFAVIFAAMNKPTIRRSSFQTRLEEMAKNRKSL